MNKLKLLIAEDSKIIRAIYKKGFADDFFETRMTSDGREALRIYDMWKPDILLLDIVMPILTGYQVLQSLREKEPVAKKLNNQNDKRGTVIIMVTSLGSKQDVIDCLNLGINGYIVKPINYKTISKRIINYYQKIYSEW